jgi:hypothetical protein
MSILYNATKPQTLAIASANELVRSNKKMCTTAETQTYSLFKVTNLITTYLFQYQSPDILHMTVYNSACNYATMAKME